MFPNWRELPNFLGFSALSPDVLSYVKERQAFSACCPLELHFPEFTIRYLMFVVDELKNI